MFNILFKIYLIFKTIYKENRLKALANSEKMGFIFLSLSFTHPSRVKSQRIISTSPFYQIELAKQTLKYYI